MDIFSKSNYLELIVPKIAECIKGFGFNDFSIHLSLVDIVYDSEEPMEIFICISDLEIDKFSSLDPESVISELMKIDSSLYYTVGPDNELLDGIVNRCLLYVTSDNRAKSIGCVGEWFN